MQSNRRVAVFLLALLALLAPTLTACGGNGGNSTSSSASSQAETPSQLLARAKKTIDNTQAVHFTLTSKGAPSGSSQLLGGEGDIKRPSSFQGTLKVQASGATVNVKVVSVGGTVYAQLPFTSSYSKVDPATFGVGDPGQLLDPQTGISQLLTAVQNPTFSGQKRVNGEVVRTVSGDIPGKKVAQVLADKDPSQPVHAVFSIAEGSAQVRQVVLTGPFFTAGQNATYTLQLSNYGENVTINAPSSS